MRFKFILIFIFLSAFLFSQNWNVFNKNYRYNYKFNYSTLVSNVLFVDTVKYSGMDTIYCLNRIGVECTGTCPTITTALNPTVTYVVPNMPQFLQRKIRKYSTGLVMLLDTSKQVIIPTCSVTQTWRFDSILNLNATCTAASSLILFGQNDSVKTIIANGIDTILLSKNFGIIQFPEPYNKNKYYRLVGIEMKNSYDQTALFGEKVPNGWDFFNYDDGDVICSGRIHYSVSSPNSGCNRDKTSITSKTLTPNGFTYDLNSYSVSKEMNLYGYQGYCGAPPGVLPLVVYSGTVNSPSSILCNPIRNYNRFYPNMIFPDDNNFFSINNLVKYGVDNMNRFYKYCGPPCSSGPHIMPNLTAIRSMTFNQANSVYEVYDNSFDINAITFGVGFGQVSNIQAGFEYEDRWCLSSYKKGGVTYFGNTDPIGLKENSQDYFDQIIYPNPANNKIQIPTIEDSEIKILNTFGELVYFSKSNSLNNQIDVSQFPVGIYFVNIESPSFKVSKKLIIQH